MCEVRRDTSTCPCFQCQLGDNNDQSANRQRQRVKEALKHCNTVE